MSDPEFFLLTPTAWLDADKYENQMLGAFVRNYASPTDTCVPESGSHEQYNKSKILERSFTDFVLDAHASIKNGAQVTLEKLGGVSFSGETSWVNRLEGKYVRFRRLTQVDKFFENVKKDREVAERVPHWRKPGRRIPVCLVVGIMICEDVNVAWEKEEQKQMTAEGQIPIATVVRSAVGAPNLAPNENPGDAKLDVSREETRGTAFRAKSGDKSIFALQLRCIKTGKILKRDRLEILEKGPSVAGGRTVGVEEACDLDMAGIKDDDLFLEETGPVSKKSKDKEKKHVLDESSKQDRADLPVPCEMPAHISSSLSPDVLDSLTILSKASQCLAILQRLTRHEGESDSAKSRHTSRTKNRFEKWCQKLGALEYGVYSLDERLRDASDLKRHILNCLLEINDALEEAQGNPQKPKGTTSPFNKIAYLVPFGCVAVDTRTSVQCFC